MKTFGWSTVTLGELDECGVQMGCFDNDKDLGRTLYVAVYELCANKDLKTLLNTRPKFRKDTALLASIFLDVLDGLEAVHEAGYLHCDLKPENVLIDEHMKAKIADFGLCQKIRKGMVVQGTPSFISPEMVGDWLGGKDTSLWGPKADIFSFGVSLSVCLTGHFPFNSSYSFPNAPVLQANRQYDFVVGITQKLKKRIEMKEADIKQHFFPNSVVMFRISKLNHTFATIIHKCLKINPDDRAPHWEIRAMLHHLKSITKRSSVKKLYSAKTDEVDQVSALFLGNKKNRKQIQTCESM
jgi:serine/threonine protein kinase